MSAYKIKNTFFNVIMRSTEDSNTQLGLHLSGGTGKNPTIIDSVDKGSISDACGLMPGDVVDMVNGKKVASLNAQEVENIIIKNKDRVHLQIRRNNSSKGRPPHKFSNEEGSSSSTISKSTDCPERSSRSKNGMCGSFMQRIFRSRSQDQCQKKASTRSAGRSSSMIVHLSSNVLSSSQNTVKKSNRLSSCIKLFRSKKSDSDQEPEIDVSILSPNNAFNKAPGKDVESFQDISESSSSATTLPISLNVINNQVPPTPPNSSSPSSSSNSKTIVNVSPNLKILNITTPASQATSKTGHSGILNHTDASVREQTTTIYVREGMSNQKGQNSNTSTSPAHVTNSHNSSVNIKENYAFEKTSAAKGTSWDAASKNLYKPLLKTDYSGHYTTTTSKTPAIPASTTTATTSTTTTTISPTSLRSTTINTFTNITTTTINNVANVTAATKATFINASTPIATTTIATTTNATTTNATTTNATTTNISNLNATAIDATTTNNTLPNTPAFNVSNTRVTTTNASATNATVITTPQANLPTNSSVAVTSKTTFMENKNKQNEIGHPGERRARVTERGELHKVEEEFQVISSGTFSQQFTLQSSPAPTMECPTSQQASSHQGNEEVLVPAKRTARNLNILEKETHVVKTFDVSHATHHTESTTQQDAMSASLVNSSNVHHSVTTEEGARSFREIDKTTSDKGIHDTSIEADVWKSRQDARSETSTVAHNSPKPEHGALIDGTNEQTIREVIYNKTPAPTTANNAKETYISQAEIIQTDLNGSKLINENSTQDESLVLYTLSNDGGDLAHNVKSPDSGICSLTSPPEQNGGALKSHLIGYQFQELPAKSDCLVSSTDPGIADKALSHEILTSETDRRKAVRQRTKGSIAEYEDTQVLKRPSQDLVGTFDQFQELNKVVRSEVEIAPCYQLEHSSSDDVFTVQQEEMTQQRGIIQEEKTAQKDVLVHPQQFIDESGKPVIKPPSYNSLVNCGTSHDQSSVNLPSSPFNHLPSAVNQTLQEENQLQGSAGNDQLQQIILDKHHQHHQQQVYQQQQQLKLQRNQQQQIQQQQIQQQQIQQQQMQQYTQQHTQQQQLQQQHPRQNDQQQQQIKLQTQQQQINQQQIQQQQIQHQQNQQHQKNQLHQHQQQIQQQLLEQQRRQQTNQQQHQQQVNQEHQQQQLNQNHQQQINQEHQQQIQQQQHLQQQQQIQQQQQQLQQQQQQLQQLQQLQQQQTSLHTQHLEASRLQDGIYEQIPSRDSQAFVDKRNISQDSHLSSGYPNQSEFSVKSSHVGGNIQDFEPQYMNSEISQDEVQDVQLSQQGFYVSDGANRDTSYLQEPLENNLNERSTERQRDKAIDDLKQAFMEGKSVNYYNHAQSFTPINQNLSSQCSESDFLMRNSAVDPLFDPSQSFTAPFNVAFDAAEHDPRILDMQQVDKQRLFMKEMHQARNRSYKSNASDRYGTMQEMLHQNLELPSRTKVTRYRGKARVLHNFRARKPIELSLRKGETVFLLRKVDRNWVEGEHHNMTGIFPLSYVEVLESIEDAQAMARVKEGSATVLHDFVPRSSLELPLRKGYAVTLVRKIDDNWYEGRFGSRRGIFPSSYVMPMREPETPLPTPCASPMNTPGWRSPSAASIFSVDYPSVCPSEFNNDLSRVSTPMEGSILEGYMPGVQTLPRSSSVTPVAGFSRNYHGAFNTPLLQYGALNYNPKSRYSSNFGQGGNYNNTLNYRGVTSPMRQIMFSQIDEEVDAFAPKKPALQGGSLVRMTTLQNPRRPNSVSHLGRRYDHQQQHQQQQFQQHQQQLAHTNPYFRNVKVEILDGGRENVGKQKSAKEEFERNFQKSQSATFASNKSSQASTLPPRAEQEIDTKVQAIVYPRYKVLHNFNSRNPEELSLNKEEIVRVVERCRDGWFIGFIEKTKAFGLFPGNFVELVKSS